MNREPALWIGTLAGIVVLLAGVFGVVIDTDTVQTLLLAAVPILSAFGIRTQVTPV